MLRLTFLALVLGGLCACGREAGDTRAIGDAARGGRVIEAVGCGSCHRIAGIPNADGQVGPPLSDMGARTMIAGVLPNTPENLEIWLLNPQKVIPGNAMPATGLTPKDAADIAAWLESRR